MSKTEIINSARKEGRAVLSEIESKELLKELGIPTTQIQLAATEADAVGIGEKMGFPVVLKIASHDISHISTIKIILSNPL